MKKLTLILLLFGATVFGKTWYLDANATGANNGTSLRDAWTSINSVATGVQDGDTVLVYQGNYEPSTSWNDVGSENAYVNFIAMEPNIFFEDIDGSTGTYMFSGNDKTYLSFKGIYFRRGGTGNDYLFGNVSVRFQNCEIATMPTIFSYYGRVAYSCSKIEIYNTLIRSQEYAFHNSVAFIAKNSTIKVDQSPMFSPISSGTFDLSNVILDNAASSGRLISASYPAASVKWEYSFFTTWDTTGFTGTATNIDSVSKSNLYNADNNLPANYSLPDNSPAISAGKYGVDIGALFGVGLKLGVKK